MSIHYILDGYNIIKSDESFGLNKGSLENQRNNLISLIAKNKPQGSERNQVTLVFDGSSDNYDSWGSSSSKTVINGITVVFSINETADRIIEDMVINDSNSSNIIVVTNDKGIKHNIGRTNAKVMPAEVFSKKLFLHSGNAQFNMSKPEPDLASEDKINDELSQKWLGKKFLCLLVIFFCFLSRLQAQDAIENSINTGPAAKLETSVQSSSNEALADKFFDIALDSYKQKDYLLAKKQFEAILSLYPAHTRSKKYLDKSNTSISSLNRKNTNNKKTLKMLRTAIMTYEKNDLENSKKQFEQILAVDPNNETAKSYLSKFDTSIGTIASMHVKELYSQAIDLYINGNYAEAIKYFEATTTAALKYFDAVILGGNQRLDTLDFIADCKQKMKEESERVDYMAKEKVRERVISQYSRAQKYYERQYYKAAYNELADALKIAKEYSFDEELSKIEDLIKETKSILVVDVFKQAETYFEKKDYDNAFEAYKKAVEYNPENTAAKEKLKTSSEALAQNNYEKGMELMMSNNTEKAKEFFKKALVYQPDKKEVLRALERIKQ